MRAVGIEGRGAFTRVVRSTHGFLKWPTKPKSHNNVDHVLLLPPVRRLTALCPPNGLAPVTNVDRGASGPVPGPKFGSISG